MKAAFKESLKEAMKAKDKIRLETIRGLLSEIQYEEMQKQISDLDADACLSVVQRELKKRKEEIEFAQKANRPQLLEKLNQEVAVLESFLPSQLSSAAIEEEFVSMKASDPAMSLGVAMKQLKEKFPGQFDGKAASEIARRVFA